MTASSGRAPRRYTLPLCLALLLVIGGLAVSFVAAGRTMPDLLKVGLGACILGSAMVLGSLAMIAVDIRRRGEKARRTE